MLSLKLFPTDVYVRKDCKIDHKKLSKIISSKKPEIIEINLRNDQKIIPKLQFGNPIEDLSPLLPRSEFYKNMDVSLIKRDKKIFEAN